MVRQNSRVTGVEGVVAVFDHEVAAVVVACHMDLASEMAVVADSRDYSCVLADPAYA
jgi:hypothetical protein